MQVRSPNFQLSRLLHVSPDEYDTDARRLKDEGHKKTSLVAPPPRRRPPPPPADLQHPLQQLVDLRRDDLQERRVVVLARRLGDHELVLDAPEALDAALELLVLGRRVSVGPKPESSIIA